MTECDIQILSAYHDGELADADRARVEAHLRACASCAAELAAIGDSSRRLRDAPLDELTQHDLAKLHAAVEEVDDYRIWRIGGSLALIAASILIIGMAWLNAMPTPSRNAGQSPLAVSPSPSPSQSWERTAVTLRVYPPLPTSAAIQPHDDQVIDYMLEGLAMGK
ncbi:MAG: putative zinc-finger [Humisphaera sp.]|nr:putative zinc-finger [Humisphaera sp.]